MKIEQFELFYCKYCKTQMYNKYNKNLICQFKENIPSEYIFLIIQRKRNEVGNDRSLEATS